MWLLAAKYNLVGRKLHTHDLTHMLNTRVKTDYYYIKIRLKIEIKYGNVDMYMCYNLLNKFT